MDTDESRGTAESAGHARPQVALSTFYENARTLVRVCGEIDIATAPTLREGLLDACGRCPGELVVDLSGVSFCDCGCRKFVRAL
jgi:anti-anti-sigma factor